MKEALIVVVGVLLAVVAVLFVIEIPEMRRYLKMKRM